MKNKILKIFGLSLLGGFLALPAMGRLNNKETSVKAATTFPISGSQTFGSNKVTGWDISNQTSYCGLYYSGKNSATTVKNTSIADFAVFKETGTYELKVWASGICNSGTNSITISTINSSGTVVNAGSALSTAFANSSNSGSAAEIKSPFVFTPTSAVSGVKIDMGEKCCLTKVRWQISKTSETGEGTETGGGTETGTSYSLVKNISELQTGVQIVIGVKSKNVAAGEFTKDNLPGVSATFNNETLSSENAFVLTLNKVDGGYKLNSSKGFVGTTAAKALSTGTETVWSISIDSADNSATISAGDYGKILYNCNSGTSLFKNYTSSPSSNMLLPQIYKSSTGGGDTPVTTYTVSYNGNGGTGEMVDPNSPYNAAANATVLANSFTAPTGKEFVKWNTKSDGTGTDYAPNATIQMVSNVTLYAIWQDKAVVEGEYYAPVTSISDLNSGDKILFVGLKDTENYVNGGLASDYLTATKVSMSSGKIYLADNETAKPITLGTNSGKYTFEIGGKLIKALSGAKLGNGDSGDEKWDISFSGDVANVVSNTSSYGKIFFNSGSPRFKTYTSSTMQSISIYKKAGTVAKVTLDNEELELFENQQTTLSVTKVEGVTPHEYIWNVTDGDCVEILSGNGTSSVTLKAVSVGTSTVQVIVNGAYSATCSITVKAAAEAIIEAGDYLVTTANGHQMLADLKDTTSPNLTDMSNAWTFEYANKGDNTYYIKNNYGYVTRKGSPNTQIIFSETASDYFTISGDADNGYKCVPSSNTSLSLYYGDDGQWRTINGDNRVLLKGQAEFNEVGYSGTLVKSTYNVGDTFDPTGLSFYYTYKGSTEQYEIKSSDITWSSIVAGTSATGTVTICGSSRTITVTGLTITNYQPDHLEFSGTCKTTYYIGESVDLTGLTVSLVSKDGEASKSEELTADDYVVSPKKISANTNAITITLKSDKTISKSFDITKEAPNYVVANYVKAGDKIVFATLDYDAYGINGGEELSFEGSTPDHTSYSYAPAGLEEFLVEDTSYGDAVALKNTKTGAYLEFNGKKFGYPKNSSITVNGSSTAYDFSYYVVVDGTPMYLNFTEGVLEDDGSITGFWGYDTIGDSYSDYVTSECLLDNSGEGLITYNVWTEANGYSGVEYTVDITWAMSGSTPIIYLPGEAQTVTEKAAWNLSFDKNLEMWNIVPYTNSDVFCSYNPDGDGNFAFYGTQYEEVTIYRNNTIALPNTVSSIVLDTTGVKTEYEVGDTFEWTGLEVTAYYSGGISSVVPVGGYSISSPDMSTEGSKTITVTYGALTNVVTKTYTITVSEPEPEPVTVVSYEITTQPTTVYHVGETVVFDGVVTAHMSDGSDVDLTDDDYTINCSGTVTTGSKTVTINLKNTGGKYLQYTITVVAAPVTLDSLTLSGQTTEFALGEEYEFDGVATAHYSNGTTKTVTPTQYSEVDMTTAGNKEVTVYYTEDQTTVSAKYSFKVTKEPEITKVELSGQKTSFVVGESFSYSGLVVKCTYDDESTSLQVPFTVDSAAFDSTTPGTYQIKVTVGGYSTVLTYDVTVSKAPINEIVLQYTSSKENAKVGDEQELFFKKPADVNVDDLEFVSSNESIATVEIRDGHVYVKYLAQGTCTITITPKDSVGGTGSATYTVLVKLYPTAVEIDDACTLEVGDTHQLTPVFTPTNATETNVSYSSDNNDVATVSSTGLITAKGIGQAEITVTGKNAEGESITSTCIVTVEPTLVTGVTLNKESTTITDGSTEQLTATVSPTNATNKDVTWSSSDSSVASVDSNGVVTANKVGTAIITVETVDGEFAATCTITVAPVNVTGVTISRDGSGDITVGDTVELTANVTPSNASDKAVAWSSSDTDIAVVDENGVVTTKAAGKVTILCITNDGNYSATIDLTIVEEQIDVPVEPDDDNGEEQDSEGLSGGAIAGISVGSTAVAGGISYGVLEILKKTGKIKLGKKK